MMTPIVLDRGTGTPLYRQIEDQLRSAIMAGRLRPGTQLPGVRTLASELGVARITVVQAYDQLASEGYLVGRVGFGTIVADELPDRAMRVDARPTGLRLVPAHSTVAAADDGRRQDPGGTARSARAAAPPRLPQANPWVPAPESLAARPGEELPFDFGQWRVNIDAFPIDLWERLLRGAWRDLSGQAAPSHAAAPAGDLELREALADHLGASRSVNASAERVVITTGIETASILAARVWLGPGRVAALEDPTNMLLRRAVEVAGTRVVPVPVDEDGLRVDRLPASAAMAAVGPSWQFPMGGTLPMHRRLALLDWAARAGALVLENDHSGEFRYNGPPLPSLQGLDRDGRVLYMSSFNRLMPVGFHLGLIVLPDSLVERFVGMAEAVGHAPSVLEQRALARFISEGHYERYLRKLRGVLAERKETMEAALADAFGSGVIVAPADAGMHLVVTLDPRFGTASAVAERARGAGVGVATVDRFRMNGGDDRQLVLFFSAMDGERIGEGVRRLAAAVREVAPARARVGAPPTVTPLVRAVRSSGR
jgi:GntR family transcriptional regulator/MocR family aminotransferase